MNVLAVLVGAAARTGGPPAFVGQSAHELERSGHKVVILATDLALAPTGWMQIQRRVAPDDHHPSLALSDTQIYHARFPRRLAFSPGLYRAAHAVAPASDVIHLHNLWQFPQYAGYRAALATGTPYVLSPHGSLDPYLRRHGRVRKRIALLLFQKELIRRAALVHVTTRAEAELIQDMVEDVPHAVVPCGIYVEEFRNLPPREELRHTRLGGYDGPIVLFLGRLTYKKGLDLLVRAFAHVRRTCECRLVIVGPDDEGIRGGLERIARGLNVANEVEFLGPLYGRARRAALASADVWALSSYTENFGIAVIEAMAAGRPVVISPAVNVADDVAVAGAGVVAELDPEAFGEAIRELLEDEQRRRRLSRVALEFAARYDWQVVAPQLIEMYRQASALGGPVRAR